MLQPVFCPECTKEFSIEEEHIGQLFKCIACECIFSTSAEDPEINLEGITTQQKEEHHQEVPLVEKETFKAKTHIDISSIDRQALYSLVKIPLDANLTSSIRNLTTCQLKTTMQYFRMRYDLFAILDLKGKKSELLSRLLRYLHSPLYREDATKRFVPHDPDEFICIRSDAPLIAPRVRDAVLASCPQCHLDLELNISHPDQQFSCPRCNTTFAIQLPKKRRRTTPVINDKNIKISLVDQKLKDDDAKRSFRAYFSCVQRRYVLKRPMLDEEVQSCCALRSLGLATPEALYAVRQCDNDVPKALVFSLSCLGGDELHNLHELGRYHARFCHVRYTTESQALQISPETMKMDHRIYSHPIIAHSFLMDPKIGCPLLRNIVFLVGPPGDSEVARQKFWRLVLQLLQLEHLLVQKYADCGRFYMKKVSKMLSRQIKVRDKAQIFDFPMRIVQQEIYNLTQMIFHAKSPSIPKELVHGYVMSLN